MYRSLTTLGGTTTIRVRLLESDSGFVSAGPMRFVSGPVVERVYRIPSTTPGVEGLVFTENGDRTIVTQTIHYPSLEARDAAIATGMQKGMDSGFDRLDAYLTTIS